MRTREEKGGIVKDHIIVIQLTQATGRYTSRSDE